MAKSFNFGELHTQNYSLLTTTSTNISVNPHCTDRNTF